MKQEESISLESVAEHFGRADELATHVAARPLAGATVVLDGYGSIARPLSEKLARLGASRFVLVDPKHYVAESVWSQCTSEEVGRLKVDVGAERLRALGAEVTPFGRDIGSVPEGVVDPDAIVVTTVDNRRADILSNRRAARMGARLIKVNIEPALELVALRAYDFRQATRVCVECQFGERHYAAQRHPKSCDGANALRRTNSPRWLSEAAANLGVFAAVDVAADDIAATNWHAQEWQYAPQTGAVRGSRLEPKRDCRWDHARRWRNVIRLREPVDSIAIRDLLHAAGFAVDTQLAIKFCQQIALRGRCRQCRRDFPVVRWFADLQSPVGICPECGVPLLAVPFAIFSETSLEPLIAVLDQPLFQWGVEPFAVIEISRHNDRATFVVGGG
jgi:hypothetical protein